MPVNPLQAKESPVSPDSKTPGFSFFLFLFGLAALVYVGTTGFLPLVGRDEPRYVEIGREMFKTGDWVTPRLGGFTWFEKPILLYWMVAASFSAFGVSEWAARLGPALCGLGSAALVWWAVRGTSEKWAQWSALALLSCGGMLSFARGATFDIVLTFSVTLALAAWWKSHTVPEKRTQFLALFWAGIGLAFLAKGLIGFVLPLGTVGVYAALRREKVKLGLLWGVPLALVVSAVWYGPVLMVNGEKFFNEFFVQQQFERFTSNKYKHHQPIWFYFEILPLLSLPWLPFLVAELAKTRLGTLREETHEANLRAFSLAWMLVPFVFFSVSGSKLPSYILPSIPGAIILLSASLTTWASSLTRQKLMGALVALMLIATGILTSTGPGIKRAEKESVRSLFQAAQKRGLGNTRVVFYSTLSRAAQFYASSTLVYGKDGEPLRLEKVDELAQFVKSGPTLILVTDSDQPDLDKSTLHRETVAHNGQLALILVKP